MPDYVKQSAVVPFRKRKKNLEVMLITSRDTGRWVLPKGHVEGNLSAAKSAEKEAYEEAGIKGFVHKSKIGTYEYAKSEYSEDKLCRVKVFPMEVHKELSKWPEQNERTRMWVKPKEASKLVHEDDLAAILRKLGKNF